MELRERLRRLDERAGAGRQVSQRTLVWAFAATSAVVMLASLVSYLVGADGVAGLLLGVGVSEALIALVRYGAWRARGDE